MGPDSEGRLGNCCEGLDSDIVNAILDSHISTKCFRMLFNLLAFTLTCPRRAFKTLHFICNLRMDPIS
jgi:hypothetical protein